MSSWVSMTAILTFSWVSLTAVPTLGAPAPDAAGATQAAGIAPVLGEEVAAVAHIDLTKADVSALVRQAIGKLADEENVRRAVVTTSDWTVALKKAGAKDLFVLFDLGDMPGVPTVVVPLEGGADGKVIAGLLSDAGTKSPVPLPATESIRGAVVAGSPAAVARIRNVQPAVRPELAEALRAGGDGPVQVAIIPSTVQRRAIEESMATLPASVGGGPVIAVTRGLLWATLAVGSEPKPMLRVVVQARDADSARALQHILKNSLELLASKIRNDRALAALVTAIDQTKPEAKDDRVTLEADLEKSAALVALPIGRWREAARRAQCVKNLKQIGLAMHNYHSAHNTFPPASSTNEQGKPLLSWRVHILPFLESQSLYNEFHLDEPWDSLHNSTLIARMPSFYACPSGSQTLMKQGKTTYLTFRGAATMFPGAAGIKIQEVTDGTSNTIFVVDASDSAAVAWTKPEDWEVTPDFPTQALFGHHSGGTNFGFADGSVRFLKETITPAVLRALTTRNGGEVISGNDR